MGVSTGNNKSPIRWVSDKITVLTLLGKFLVVTYYYIRLFLSLSALGLRAMSGVSNWIMGMREGGIEGELAVSFLTVKWLYAKEVCLMCLILANLVKQRKLDPEKKINWVHDLAGALCLGEIPAPLVNDTICTMFLVLWPIFRFNDKLAVRITTLPIVWQAVHFFATLSRANQICNFTDRAFHKFSPFARHYPLALIGPIMVGTIRGSGANFWPLHKGLSCLKGGVPLNTQLAFVGATVWHLLVNDKFLLGAGARGLLLLGGFTPSATLIKNYIIITCLVLNIVWTISGLKTFNPFMPIWSFLNYLLGIDVPEENFEKSEVGKSDGEPVKKLYDFKERKKLEFVYDSFRSAFIALMFGIYIFNQLPPSSFSLNESLSQGDYLGTCVFLPDMRACEPTIAVLEEGGVLKVYRGGTNPTDTRRNLVWSSGNKIQSHVSGEFRASLNKAGSLFIHSGDNKSIWETPISSDVTDFDNGFNSKVSTKAVVVNGGLEVRIGDKVTWSSLHN